MSATTELNLQDRLLEAERLRNLERSVLRDIDEVLILRAEGKQLKSLTEAESERCAAEDRCIECGNTPESGACFYCKMD